MGALAGWSRSLCIGCVLLLGAACVAPQTTHGPLPVRNQHPTQLTVLQLPPESSSCLPVGAVSARVASAYTSLFLDGRAGTSAFTMDGELWRTGLQLRAGIAEQLEVGIELAALRGSGGFLDSFLIDYHDMFGFPSQGRDRLDKNRFGVAADYQGQRVFELDDDAVLLTDLPCTLKYELVPPHRAHPGVALRTGIELPVADADRGAGNGVVDVAVGVCASWPLDACTVHGALQHTFAGSSRRARAAGFAFADVTALQVDLELPLFEDLDAMVELAWETSTLRQLGFERAAREQLLLWVGGRLAVDDGLFVELAFGEDVIGFVSPDFTGWLGFAWLPSGRRAAGE